MHNLLSRKKNHIFLYRLVVDLFGGNSSAFILFLSLLTWGALFRSWWFGQEEKSCLSHQKQKKKKTDEKIWKYCDVEIPFLGSLLSSNKNIFQDHLNNILSTQKIRVREKQKNCRRKKKLRPWLLVFFPSIRWWRFYTDYYLLFFYFFWSIRVCWWLNVDELLIIYLEIIIVGHNLFGQIIKLVRMVMVMLCLTTTWFFIVKIDIVVAITQFSWKQSHVLVFFSVSAARISHDAGHDHQWNTEII